MPVSLAEFCAAITDLNLVSGEEFRDIMAGRTAGQVADVEQFAKSLIARKTLTKYQAQAILSGQAKRLVLGSYLLVDQIGQGGMGVVLKARHLRLKRFVAIKVLSPQVTKNPAALKRFQREVQAAAKLEHPNIVAAFDADVARNVHFLVMQYIEGRDLATTIQEQGPFSVEQALQCLSQAACGLEYAHSQGVIHRDIKPANFILEKGTGIIKVLDMGLARIDEACGLEMEGGDTGLTHTGTIMGTVDFMSPEQAANTKKADCRSDIYSLGVTLYYLLTGELLYNGDTMMEKLLAHRERPIPSLRQIRADVPEAVDAVFRKMVAKNPADRYQTMTDTLADLLACLSGAPTSVPVGTFRAVAMGDSMDSEFRAFVSGLDSEDNAQTAFVPGQSDEVRPPTTDGGSQATKPGSATHGARQKTGPKSQPELKPTSSSSASFHWKVVGVAAVVLLLICLGMWFMNGRKATPIPTKKTKSSAKSAPRTKSEQQPQVSPIEIGAPAVIAKLPPLPPNDSPLNNLPGLLLEPGPIRGVKRWQVETNAPRSAVSAADWAPDNRQIIVGFQSGELRIYEPATWQLRGLLSGHEGGVRSVSWNPEGSRIASSGNDNTVRLWQGDGTPGPVLRHCVNPGVVVWSPDGLHLLAASNDRNRPVIQMWSADGQPEAVYTGHTQPAKSLGWSGDARHFISASEDGSLRIWDLSGNQVREITVTDKRFQVVRWSRLGAIAAYDHEGNVYLFPDASQPPSIKYKLSPRGMVWSPDGEQLAVGFNTDVQIWDTEGQTISQQSNVEAPYLRWSPDGKHLLACGKSIVVWEPGGEVTALQQLPWATAIACDPSGRQFVTGYSDGSLHWSGPAGRPTQTVTVPEFYVSSLAWSPDGQTVAAGGRNQIRLFTADGQASATIDARVGVQQVKWSPDSKQMAVVSSDAKIRLFNVDGSVGPVLEGHTQQVVGVDWGTDGQLVSVSRDKTVRLWKSDGSPGPEVAPLANTDYYMPIWSPDGRQLAVLVTNKTNTRLQIWNADGSSGSELKGPKGLYSFAWSRDGENIIAAESSGEFRIWTRDGQTGPSYPGTIPAAKALVIAGPNRILTLADDRAVRGWDATTFKPLWVSLATADHETATLHPDGKITHAKGQTDHVFLFLTEQDTGRIEVLTQSQFQRLNGKSK